MEAAEMCIRLRPCRPGDFHAVAAFIHRLYLKYVTPGCSTRAGVRWWSAFLSPGEENRAAIEKRYRADTIALLAVRRGRLAGVVMGNKRELVRLFVDDRLHRRGIGRRLFAAFEARCRRLGSRRFRVVASLYAVPFYLSCGCRRTTGVRDYHGVRVQPLRKTLAAPLRGGPKA